MRWPTSASALGSAGVSVGAAAVGVAVGALELSGRPHADVWANGWVIGSVVVAGVGLVTAIVFLVLGIFARGRRGESAGSRANTISGGTFHGPVMQGRDFTGFTFPAQAEPPRGGRAAGPDAE
jgi:hypothetical protein